MDYISQQQMSAEGFDPDLEYQNGIGSWLKKRASFVKKVVKGDFKGVAKDVGNVFNKKKSSAPAASPTPAPAASPTPAPAASPTPAPAAIPSVVANNKMPFIIGGSVLGALILGFVIFKVVKK